ncbi:MAG: MATE family efflux transporter [Alistipes sp.]|nr:MATE family efflux transporter [Alistipes sp.]
MQKYGNKEILKISFPVLVSLLMEQIVGLTDTAYLGRVGETELAASALAGVFYLVIFMIGFGFSIGAQVLIARRNGEGRYEAIGSIFTQGMAFLLMFGALLFALSRIFSPRIMALFIESPQICDAAVRYLDWRVCGFFFSFAAVMFRAFYVGTTRTRILTANSIVMVLTNVVLNYVLIFGKFGFPALGIAGAAIASAVAEAVSAGFFIVYTRMRCDWRRYRLFEFRGINPRQLGEILSVAVWIMLQEGLAFLSWFIFFLCIEHLGERPLAATNIVRSISSMLFMFVAAFASTASSLVSNLIGAGRSGEIMPLCRRVIRLCYCFVVPLSLVVAFAPRLFLGIYTDNAGLAEFSIPSLLVMLTSFVPCVPGITYQFCVSGTGDTRAALGLVLATLAVYVAYTVWLVYGLRADVAVCWTTDHVYYLMLTVICYLYMRSGRWRRNRI